MSWPRIVVSVPWAVALVLDPRMTRTIGSTPIRGRSAKSSPAPRPRGVCRPQHRREQERSAIVGVSWDRACDDPIEQNGGRTTHGGDRHAGSASFHLPTPQS